LLVEKAVLKVKLGRKSAKKLREKFVQITSYQSQILGKIYQNELIYFNHHLGNFVAVKI